MSLGAPKRRRVSLLWSNPWNRSIKDAIPWRRGPLSTNPAGCHLILKQSLCVIRNRFSLPLQVGPGAPSAIPAAKGFPRRAPSAGAAVGSLEPLALTIAEGFRHPEPKVEGSSALNFGLMVSEPKL